MVPVTLQFPFGVQRHKTYGEREREARVFKYADKFVVHYKWMRLKKVDDFIDSIKWFDVVDGGVIYLNVRS